MKKLLYRLSDQFNLLLFTIAIILILILLYYSQTIVHDLRAQSRTILEFYAQIHSHAAAENDSTNINFLFENIIQKTNFPVINTDEHKNPLYWENISVDPNDKSPAAIEKVKKMIINLETEMPPVPIIYLHDETGDTLLKQYLYYGDSNLITRLIWLPYIEIGVFGLFIFVAFLGLQSIKRSEEKSIWVGMAKETAHQLGTPLSSLMGWLEIIKNIKPVNGTKKVLVDMENDLKRLNKVATRFSQIGSKTDLKKQDLIPVLKDTIGYFRRRLPQTGKKIKIIENFQKMPAVYINRDLFEWVVENLIKNSLDAIEKDQGLIELSVGTSSENADDIFIDIKDNGKGITAQNRRLIFRPGFSTKKRGWGLGLNLAKRIIEEYHHGKLMIKDTKPGEGTTMRIILRG